MSLNTETDTNLDSKPTEAVNSFAQDYKKFIRFKKENDYDDPNERDQDYDNDRNEINFIQNPDRKVVIDEKYTKFLMDLKGLKTFIDKHKSESRLKTVEKSTDIQPGQNGFHDDNNTNKENQEIQKSIKINQTNQKQNRKNSEKEVKIREIKSILKGSKSVTSQNETKNISQIEHKPTLNQKEIYTQTEPVLDLSIEPCKWNIKYENYVKLTQLLHVQVKLNDQTSQTEFLSVLNLNNFINDLTALDILKEAIYVYPTHTFKNLQLILKWLTLRFNEINPFFIYKSLDYLKLLFDMCIDKNYKLLDQEADLFIPHFIQYLSDSRPYIQIGIRLVLRQIIIIYDDKKVFRFLLNGLKFNNTKCNLACLEELAFMLNFFGFEFYKPEKSLNKIAKMIDNENIDVKNTALSVFSICIVKYGAFISDFIDPKYIDELEIYVNKYYDQAKEICYRDEDLVGLYRKVFDQIRFKVRGINSELESYGQFDRLNVYIKMISDNNLENNVNGLLNISLFLLDKIYHEKLLDHIETLLIKCCLKLENSTITYYEDNEYLPNNNLIQMLTIVMSLIFEKNLGKNLNHNLLKSTFKSVFITMTIFDNDYYKLGHFNTLLMNMINFIDETDSLCILLQLLKEVCEEKKDFYEEFRGFIIKYLWIKFKNINLDNSIEKINEQVELVNNDLLKRIDIKLVLNEVNLFLESNPTKNWKDIKTRLPLKIINYIIKDIVRFSGSKIGQILDSVKISNEAELRFKCNEYLNTN